MASDRSLLNHDGQQLASVLSTRCSTARLSLKFDPTPLLFSKLHKHCV